MSEKSTSDSTAEGMNDVSHEMPCWRWEQGELVPDSLPLENSVRNWRSATEAQGYAMYAYYYENGGITTYLLARMTRGERTPDYIAVSVMLSGEGLQQRQTIEMVRLPDWRAVLHYLALLLPVTTGAYRLEMPGRQG